MNFLLIGGAGYIGSNVAYLLKKNLNDKVVIYDNLSTGTLPLWNDKNLFFVKGDCGDKLMLLKTMQTYKIDFVMNFAAKTSVGESYFHPLDYYRNNFVSMLNVLTVMSQLKIKNFIFSSSAAVYGNSANQLIREDHPKLPMNAYGGSKLACEQLLEFCTTAYDLNCIVFRYFNVAGAGGEKDELGIYNKSTTLLIPKINSAILNHKKFTIFGNDYKETIDHTCVRDYVHVTDVAQAHLRAIEWLKTKSGHHVFNVGSGHGYSVMECVKTVEKYLHKTVDLEIEARRHGDPTILIADIKKIKSQLNWTPQKNLYDMIQSDYLFRQNVLK